MGGQALERYAGTRARRELSALLARAPRVVHRYENGELLSLDIEAVRVGDQLLVKSGEIVPVRRTVRHARALDCGRKVEELPRETRQRELDD